MLRQVVQNATQSVAQEVRTWEQLEDLASQPLPEAVPPTWGM